MVRLPRLSICLILAGLLAALPFHADAARSAARDHSPDACANAGTATNSVVRFYLAVDRRQFAAAYRCFAPSEQARLPYATFVAGYAHTVSSRLVIADSEVPNGTKVDHIAIDLHGVDRTSAGLVSRTFMGRWYVDTFGHLVRGVIRPVRIQTVRTIPRTNPLDVFAYLQEEVLSHVHADVTGDHAADDIYLISGKGCASCHAQQIYIYSHDRLVFQQEVDDAGIRVNRGGSGMEISTDTPGSPGLDSCCPTSRTYEEWAWTPYGFTLRGEHIKAVASR